MTTQTIRQALRNRKPAVIKERGQPTYVILDWRTYKMWEEMREDSQDLKRLNRALADPKNQKKIPWADVKKQIKL